MVGYRMTGEVAARLSVPGGLVSVSCGAAEPVPRNPVRLGQSAVRFETRAVPVVAALLMIVAGAGVLLRLAWKDG